MAPGRDVDDTCCPRGCRLSSGLQFWKDEVGEEEMTDVVCAELHFDAVFSEGAFGNCHDASIVDENVDVFGVCVDLCRSGANRLLRCEIHDEFSNWNGGERRVERG